MRTYREMLKGWIALALIALSLAGCAAKPQPISYRSTPPVFVAPNDISCVTDETAKELLIHNCTVDYKAEYCDPKLIKKLKETKHAH